MAAVGDRPGSVSEDELTNWSNQHRKDDLQGPIGDHLQVAQALIMIFGINMNIFILIISCRMLQVGCVFSYFTFKGDGNDLVQYYECQCFHVCK